MDIYVQGSFKVQVTRYWPRRCDCNMLNPNRSIETTPHFTPPPNKKQQHTRSTWHKTWPTSFDSKFWFLQFSKARLGSLERPRPSKQEDVWVAMLLVRRLEARESAQHSSVSHDTKDPLCTLSPVNFVLLIGHLLSIKNFTREHYINKTFYYFYYY